MHRQRFVPYNRALLGACSTARVEYTANTVEEQSDLIRQTVEKILRDFPPDA